MKQRITLERSGTGDGTDLVIEADATTPIGRIADAISDRDPARTTGVGLSSRTLRATGPDGTRVIDPAAPLGSAPIRAGEHIAVVDADGRYVDAADGRVAAAVLSVTSGPDAGSQFDLPRGAAQVGRSRDCEISLTDPMVSKRHARLNVTDVVEIIDLGSANGVLVGEELVSRVVLRAGEEVRLGETTLVLRSVRPTEAQVGPAVEFNRPPYLTPRFDGSKITAPKIPSPPGEQRFPVASLVAPLLLGAVLFAVTRNALSVVFVGLSPIFMIGNFIEGRRARRAATKDAIEAFQGELRVLDERLAGLLEEEESTRRDEHPATAQIVAAAMERGPLLWVRRPDLAGFLELRVGTADVPSRTVVDVGLSSGERGIPGLRSALDEVVAVRGVARGVPVVARLRECGSVGVAGPREAALGVTRALVAQVAALHSPADVVIGAVLDSAREDDWAWLKWLPHTSSEHSPLEGATVAVGEATGRALASSVRDLIDRRTGRATGADDDGPHVHVVLIVEDSVPVDRSLLVDIGERGRAAGVHLVWVAPQAADLPAVCGTFTTIDPATNHAFVGHVADGSADQPVVLEPLDGPTIGRFARRLAPVIDVGARVDGEADLPALVSLVDHLGFEVIESVDAVVDRWRLSGSLPGDDGVRRRRSTLPLHAIVGSATHEPLQIDLRTHGPHALVGGTTGAGKSEFLQSWVMALAANHSPKKVTFLFVDYKGGSAFGRCVDLPHSVGLVTDLNQHLVRRALRSLNAELRHREHILSRKKAKDVLDLERAGDPETPPSLIIVVDEFAALVQEVPEFVDGVVNVAQRGRSLGLHLVLATQRPAGVIRDNLRANTNLRIALRMADDADSQDVIGSSMAAGFDASRPGRGVAKLGPGRLVPFQAAYVGGVTSDDPPPPPIDIHENRLGGLHEWPEPEVEDGPATTSTEAATDLDRLVSSMQAAASVVRIAPPRKPWLPVLDDVYDLGRNPEDENDFRLMSRTDESLVFGVLDDPDNQARRSVAFVPDQVGNMAIIGTGGAGKSAALRTLAVAAGLSIRGGPCHVYGLDFGSRGLHMLDPLPHVGSIIDGDDEERLTRLLRTLRSVVDERAARFSALGAGTIVDYRRLADRPREPRILLLVDGYAAFRQEYEVARRIQTYDTFQSIATDGRPVGVHIVVTADRIGAIPSALGSVIQQRLVLRLASETEYASAGVPATAFSDDAPPGRGFWTGHEVQVAVLGGTANTVDQSAAINRLAAGLAGTADPVIAPPIGRLPEVVDLDSLPITEAGVPVVGISDDGLVPLGLASDSPLVVVGPPRSGKTTALATLALAARRADPDVELCLIGQESSALASMVRWDRSVDIGASDAADQLDELGKHLSELGPGRAMLVLDDVPRLGAPPHDQALLSLLDAATAAAHRVIGDGEISAMTTNLGLPKAMKSMRHGLVLVPDQHDGENILKTPLPRVSRVDFPPGRGFYIRNARAVKVHLALPSDGG